MGRYFLIIVLLASLLGVGGYSLWRRVGAQEPRGYLVQQGLYPLKLQVLHGAPVQPGRPVLLEFWRIDCPVCMQSIPHLRDLQTKLGSRGLQVVGVTTDSPEEIQRFLRRASLNYTIAKDPGDRLGDALQVDAIPDALLLDSQGTIRWRGDPRFITEEEIAKVLP